MVPVRLGPVGESGFLDVVNSTAHHIGVVDSRHPVCSPRWRTIRHANPRPLHRGHGVRGRRIRLLFALAAGHRPRIRCPTSTSAGTRRVDIEYRRRGSVLGLAFGLLASLLAPHTTPAFFMPLRSSKSEGLGGFMGLGRGLQRVGPCTTMKHLLV